jgi:cytochrome bd-type quinol oxidase subunit 2
METDLFYKAAGAILAPFRIAQRAIENTKQNLKEDAREALSDILKILIISFCALFFLIFGSITAATAINASSDSPWLGYASVAGFYLLLAIGMYVWKQAQKEKRQREFHEQHKEM